MNRPHFRTPYSEGCFRKNTEESVGLESLGSLNFSSSILALELASYVTINAPTQLDTSSERSEALTKCSL